MLLTRAEFIHLVKTTWNNGDEFAAIDSPLWIPEQAANRKSRFFVKLTHPHGAGNRERVDNMTGRRMSCHCAQHSLCYSYGDEESWWGFRDRNDAVIFILKYQ